MFVGIDVGGTNTDAVLMDGTNLRAWAKVPTTPDVTSGILGALQEVLTDKRSLQQVSGVMLGTTHFTNALLERKGLTPTGIVRLALPATTLLPPLVDWPQELSQAIGGFSFMVHGGHEFDGREISPVDPSELRSVARDLRKNGAQAVAISGVFSPVNPAHENQAAAIIQEEAPELRISLSHEHGRIGLLERENAAVLNACLGAAADHTIKAFQEALRSLGLNARLYLSQNDGTLMDAEFAARFPVLTIASGPTNSMRGAAYLSGIRDGIVVDVGGTSTDVGALVNGFPREAAVAVSIAGVRTNFRMPDVLSIPLGGGSILREDPLRIGPDSVGYRLTAEALVFGGSTATATDVAVAGGMARLGTPSLANGLAASTVEWALQEIQARVETCIDQVKLSAGPVPVVLVGGGSILLGDSLNGASQVLRPEHSGVANAIGAAIAQVGGQVEKVFSLEDVPRQEALALARAEAVSKAVAAGADPATVEIVEIDEVPLTYLPSNATLIRVKAAGDLAQPFDRLRTNGG
ncbi:MAG: hydantoinase/oxoprolinase family protein [Chloroflexi bacterium]|nr:hydantoinase/oxoprolinase family protein [Chloroflexota bacterium]